MQPIFRRVAQATCMFFMLQTCLVLSPQALAADEAALVARVDRLKLPSYSGFVMPKLTAVTDASGAISDVTISYPMDLTAQMLEFSKATASMSSSTMAAN